MWRALQRTVIALVGIVWLLLSVSDQALAADRALLVGLEHYYEPDVPPTPGGVDDARSVARTLEVGFGFPRNGIRLLLNEEATAEAIVRTFQEWLIEGTQPGDRVFFLYAGHGSQLKDQNGDEVDGYDETLAPYDVDPQTGARQIRDDVIDSLIAQLSGRRAVLLFDSCHSGTLTRSVGPPTGERFDSSGVRFLPRPDQMRRLSRRRSASNKAPYRLTADRDGEQRVFDAPGEIGRISGIVAISAAEPGQLAYTLEVDGQIRGALSYLFQQAVLRGDRGGLLAKLGDLALKSTESTLKTTATTVVKGGTGDKPGRKGLDALQQSLTISSIEMVLKEGMKGLQESGRLKGEQRPEVDVLSQVPIEQQSLWGDHKAAAAAAMTHPLDDRWIEIRTVSGRTHFESGEALTFEVRTDRPGYLYLLVFSERKQATCLFPNPVDRRNLITSGSLVIPTHSSYQLPVQEPYGSDLVTAVLADEPLPLCEKIHYGWDEIFERVQLDTVQQNLRRRARRGLGFKISAPDPKGLSPPAWQSALLPLQTTAGASER